MEEERFLFHHWPTPRVVKVKLHEDAELSEDAVRQFKNAEGTGVPDFKKRKMHVMSHRSPQGRETVRQAHSHGQQPQNDTPPHLSTDHHPKLSLFSCAYGEFSGERLELLTGTRVFYWNSAGQTVYATVQSVETTKDGTVIVSLKEDTGNTILLPAKSVTKV
ncbi:hypothetical protein R3P38DRAFT_3367463 [Favolaschia claudopus]|uniref:Uncharacterized protein n=1 Tax=Favolaschia claudopus TaxID=2862362 RepID=A0AAW0A7B5_9AGAR